MAEWKPASSLKPAADPDDQLEIDPAILAWFKARGRGWQEELNGVLAFYIDTIEHPASQPAPETPHSPPAGPA
jgi:uncharacterized protein (DUF4415 family)